ncbi:uncharacterized protein SPPG_04809 [Spizellomyces punctatus DAOM BR117]|uniref:Uncharacterized protein n=1 Tax=Spizellomyces punctatus (strain DAOM BR117) TaxID=645134 RepID=A0A0L0HHA5_SPIPD|nr:uncharacterized protein SPPG_04809 [Spizellomyces punctatus DAOM BR117]KND00493.1 hypothetical protein SPPG_04809 [Spizellomyces punctatus DAOM BR117]|eukprot:XP_016608532.1 hypothetical protein SPPG_04809 [Spizellomyces punctatus DAOM BR117]
MPKQPLQPTEDGSESSSSQCRIKAPVGLQNIDRFLRPSGPANSSSGNVDTTTPSLKSFKKPAAPVAHLTKTAGGNAETKNTCKPTLNAKLAPKRSMLERYAEDVDEGTLVVNNVGLAKKLRISRESSLADTELAYSEDEDEWVEPYDDEYVIARMDGEQEELSYVNMSRLSQSQSELLSYSAESSGMSQKLQGSEGTVVYIVGTQKQTFTGESAASHGIDSARSARSASKRNQEQQLQDQEHMRESYPADSDNHRQLEQRHYTDYMMTNSAPTQTQHHDHVNNATMDNDTNGAPHSDAEMTIEERYGLHGMTADDIRHRLKGGQTVRNCSLYTPLDRMDVFTELGRKMASKLEDVNKTFEKNDTFYSTVLSELSAHKAVLAKQGKALEERRKNLENHFFGFEKAVGVKLR